MARKKTTTGNDGTPFILTVPENSIILPEDSNLIASLAKAKENATKATRSAGETFNKKFAKAQDEKHVDKRAFNIANGLHVLPDEQLRITFFHLIRYMNDLGIPDRATKQQEMFESGETGPGVKKQDGDDGDGESNVTRIGSAARKVAENAGA